MPRSCCPNAPRNARSIRVAPADPVVTSAEHIETRSRRQAALIKLGQFALKVRDLTAVMHEAVATVKKTLEVDLCAILRAQPARECFTVWATSGWAGDGAAALEVPLENGTQAGMALVRGEPVVIADAELETSLAWTREFMLSRGMRSSAAVRLGEEAESLGALVAHARRPGSFGADEVYFLQSVAMVLEAAIQRADGERRIYGSELLLLEAVEGVPDPFVVVGRDWRILYSSESFRSRLRGLRIGPEVYEDFRQIPAFRLPRARSAFEAAMERGEHGSFELHSEAEQLWFSVSVSPNHDGFTAHFHDVSELIRRNRDLAARARQQSALATLAEAAVSSLETEELLWRAVRIVADTLGVEFTSVLEVSEDRATVTLRAGVGFDASEIGTVLPIKAGTRIGYALSRNETVVTEHIDESDLLYSALAGKHGIVSGIDVVIGSTGTTRGTLAAHSRARRTYSKDEIVFLSSAAGILGTALERQRIFAETEQLNTRLSDVVGSIGEPFWSVDRDWNVTFANAKFLERLGLSAEQTIGHNFFKIFRGMSDEAADQFRQAAADAIPSRFESFSQEHKRWFEIAAYPTADGMLFYSRDVSERKQAEAMVRSLNADLERRVWERTEQLQAANSELESFSYSVSHDLRAPLRSVDGFSLALLEDFADDLKPEAKAHLERVRAAAARMGRLIDDLLKLSRIGRRELTPQELDLSELSREVIAQLRESEPEREVEVTVATGLRVVADVALLRIALENLIENAWKFTQKTASARIEIGALEEGGGFYVRDNGVGFDMACSDKLFGPFQRLHSVAEFEGTGIGLATVQRIVRRHGGRVWAEAVVGSGATFYATFESAAATAAV